MNQIPNTPAFNKPLENNENILESKIPKISDTTETTTTIKDEELLNRSNNNSPLQTKVNFLIKNILF